MEKRSLNASAIIHTIDIGCLSEEKCRQLLLEIIYPEGPCCPRCGAAYADVRANRFFNDQRCLCANCGRKFSALGSSRLLPKKWQPEDIVLAVVLFEIGFSNADVAARIGREHHAVGRLRKHLNASQERKRR